MTNKRTNKAERTAMNLTRIAAMNNIHPNDHLSTELYEIAQDAGCAMFDGRDAEDANIDSLVFIPHKIADERFHAWEKYMTARLDCSDRYVDSSFFNNMVCHWYVKAMHYIPNEK